MSTLTDRETREIPDWLDEIELCHLANNDLSARMCGLSFAVKPRDCGEYRGEAVCPSCGNPTCPRCAQLAALEDALWWAA